MTGPRTGDPEGSACSVRCSGCDPRLAELLAPRTVAAAEALGLDRMCAAVEVCVDDLPAGQDGWLHLEPGDGGRPCLTLYCSPDALRDGEAPGSAGPGREIWEQTAAPRGEEPWLPGGFDADEVDAFLHHQFLLACDLLRHELQPATVPSGQAAAFGAAWDVTIDGRLERAGLAGYTPAARRRRFSYLFASATVLLPDHWQIFESLWEGRLASQAEVLGVVRRLPRL